MKKSSYKDNFFKNNIWNSKKYLGNIHGSRYPGNKMFIQRKSTCVCDGNCPKCMPIQAKLKIGKPNDKYEQEADRVADQVMRMPEPDMSNVKGEMSNVTGTNNTLQRQPGETCPGCKEEEEETVQPKTIADQITPLIQRQEETEEEEPEPEEVNGVGA